MTAPANFDPERITQVLARHRVDCVVVGGIAGQLHGASRPTQDLDLVADFDRENLRRLAAAMAELGATARTEGYVDPATREASKALVHEAFFATIGISTWDTDAGPLDILRNIPDAAGGRLTYEQLPERAVDHNYAGTIVHVASLDDIVASKTWADRPRDSEALPELDRLRSEQPHGHSRA